MRDPVIPAMCGILFDIPCILCYIRIRLQVQTGCPVAGPDTGGLLNGNRVEVPDSAATVIAGS